MPTVSPRRTGAGRRGLLLAAAAAVGAALLPLATARADGDGPPAFYGADGQFVRLQPPRPAPVAPIIRGRSGVLDLGRLRGRVLLVNVWATWCAPCRWEMPALDRLQAELGGPDFAVVALAIDEAGYAAVRRFYDRLGLEHLPIYVDRGGNLRGLAPTALPQSYVVDRSGRIVGYLKGAADWNSAAARALLRHYLDGGGRSP